MTWGLVACGPSSLAMETPVHGTATPFESQTVDEEQGTPTVAPPTEEVIMTPTVTPQATEVKPPAKAERVVQLARQDLAQKLGLEGEAIRLVSVEAVEWSDTSLGCPQPGMMYAQVITPGFRVVLAAQGQTYEYHTDLERSVVLCANKAK